VASICPLIDFLIQIVSLSILNDPTTMPLVGYKLLPGLVNVIALLKEICKVSEVTKDQ
jgi:hypothetical protein